MLFHEHDYAMKDEKHGMSPWPVANLRPGNDGSYEDKLPNLETIKSAIIQCSFFSKECERGREAELTLCMTQPLRSQSMILR